MVETETETKTLADLSVASIYKRPVFKVRDQDRAGTGIVYSNINMARYNTKNNQIYILKFF